MTDETPPYRWAVRGVDEVLVRRLRIMALRQGLPVYRLLDEALADYLEKHGYDTLKVFIDGVER
jgi:hypothetical protein